jgi:DNA-binding NtrC family response regulator
MAFLKEFSKENGKSIEGFEPKARSALYAYTWPGNIRELRNCIESAVVMARGGLIGLDDLPPTLSASQGEQDLRVPSGSSLADAEKILIRETLAAQNGNKSRTAEILGIGRKTLYQKLVEFGLDSPAKAAAEDDSVAAPQS